MLKRVEVPVGPPQSIQLVTIAEIMTKSHALIVKVLENILFVMEKEFIKIVMTITGMIVICVIRLEYAPLAMVRHIYGLIDICRNEMSIILDVVS